MGARRERGSAALQSIFAIVFLMVLVLGVLQVAFSLWARNVVASAAHEAARSAIELGASPQDAHAVATRVVHEAAGGLVRDLAVATDVRDAGELSVLYVRVTGRVIPIGPVPLSLPLDATASARRESRP